MYFEINSSAANAAIRTIHICYRNATNSQLFNFKFICSNLSTKNVHRFYLDWMLFFPHENKYEKEWILNSQLSGFNSFVPARPRCRRCRLFYRHFIFVGHAFGRIRKNDCIASINWPHTLFPFDADFAILFNLFQVAVRVEGGRGGVVIEHIRFGK